VVTSHTGKLDVDNDEVKKSYYGFAEIKNAGSTPFKNIRVMTTAYFNGPAGLVSVGHSTVTPDIDFLAPGETSPLDYDISDINFFVDVDQVRFMTTGDETDETPARPPVRADGVYLFQPHSWLAVSLSFAATNVGSCSVGDIKAVVSFYDRQGQILDADSDRLPDVLDDTSGSATRYPLLAVGRSFYYVAHAQDIDRLDQVASYKIQFTGAQTQELPLSLHTSSVNFSNGGIDDTITGVVSNPSAQIASQVFVAPTAFDAQNHVIDVSGGEVLTAADSAAATLAPGQARPFKLDGFLSDDEAGAVFDHGSVTALASDTVPGPACGR